MTFTLTFGVFALVDGISNIVHAIGGRRNNEHWWILLLIGWCGIGIGLLTFSNPAITDSCSPLLCSHLGNRHRAS